MACNTFATALCCCTVSRNSCSSRAFSMAPTVSEPMSSFSLSIGTANMVRTPAVFDGRNGGRIARGGGLVRGRVGDVNAGLCRQHASTGGILMGPIRRSPAQLGIGRWHVVRGDDVQGVTVPAVDRAVVRATD